MAIILPPNKKVLQKANKLKILKKLNKAIKLLSNNPNHPSLNTELLHPKKMGIYSFRVDRKTRALFFKHKNKNVLEIINLTTHYH
ncbi:type II toxin-antitoxin system YoeB family toxin [Patescibacteria group bacterium]|nr:type II toxin-antitoxin system YoeB family toxin [Patescibacteria group bacterium]